MNRGRIMSTKRGKQKTTDEDMSSMVDPWAPQALVCSPLINPYMKITCTLCSKTLFTRLCLPNMRRKALGSLSINSISSTQGKILCLWDLGCSFAIIKAPSLLIPKVYRKFLALTLLSSWWSFLHWLNLQRVFGQPPSMLSMSPWFSCSSSIPLVHLWTINSLIIIVHHHYACKDRSK